MLIRPTTPADLTSLRDIDGTVESSTYLHLQRSGDDLNLVWHIEERPLRTKLIEAAVLDDESQFLAEQIARGHDEGLGLVAEHDGQIVASLVAQPRQTNRTLKVPDLRVDYDYRRQGLGSALLFRAIQAARDAGLRAVVLQTRSNNYPAARFLLKTGFELAGLDTQLYSNHDLVKEAATLFWYAALD